MPRMLWWIASYSLLSKLSAEDIQDIQEISRTTTIIPYQTAKTTTMIVLVWNNDDLESVKYIHFVQSDNNNKQQMHKTTKETIRQTWNISKIQTYCIAVWFALFLVKQHKSIFLLNIIKIGEFYTLNNEWYSKRYYKNTFQTTIIYLAV